MHEHFGNPSSQHWAGVPARERIEAAREQIAALIGANSQEIVFTSGGSEANNLAIKGLFETRRHAGCDHIITSAVEHPATLAPCRYLQRHGARLTVLPVDGHGRVDPDSLDAALTPGTALVSIMHANNEVGTVQPIETIGAMARQAGVPLHVDAAQSAGKLAIDVDSLGADLLSLAGHKMYAPKGVGALFVRAGISLEPLIHGAGHEHGLRAGTESALLACALGQACELVGDLTPMEEVQQLRDRLWQRLHSALGERILLNGHPVERLPNTLSVAFPVGRGSDVLARLPHLASTVGSACHADRTEPSPTLSAMGVDEKQARGTVRFSLGRGNTIEEIDALADDLIELINQPRKDPGHER